MLPTTTASSSSTTTTTTPSIRIRIQHPPPPHPPAPKPIMLLTQTTVPSPHLNPIPTPRPPTPRVRKTIPRTTPIHAARRRLRAALLTAHVSPAVRRQRQVEAQHAQHHHRLRQDDRLAELLAALDGALVVGTVAAQGGPLVLAAAVSAGVV
ncbi:hypothetical protein CSPX01_00054 [Colletotrichum filicis]|nr:hypothetical protein CSPX01_00054 [Colletotrichum filicis]